MAEVLATIALCSSLVTLLFEIIIKRTIDHAYKRSELQISSLLDIEKQRISYVYPKEFGFLENAYCLIFQHLQNCYEYRRLFESKSDETKEIETKILQTHDELLKFYHKHSPFIFEPIKNTFRKIIDESSFEKVCEENKFNYEEELKIIEEQISKRLKLS